MDRKACGVALLAVLVGVALAALAGTVAGDTEAAYGIGPTRLEDDAAPGLPVMVGVHRRRLASNIEPSVLNANTQACIGSCPARGGSYTGRGCSSAYQCKG